MLKKAGIVVAAAAAGLLAVSPLAFAGDKDHHDGPDTYSEVNEAGNNTRLVNVADNEVNAPVQACNNDVSTAGAGGAVNEATSAVAGAASLFGDVQSEASPEDNEVRDCEQANAGGDDSASIG